MIDGGKDYYTLSLRNILLSRKNKVVDLDTVYMINYGFNTPIVYCDVIDLKISTIPIPLSTGLIDLFMASWD
jgi:hypothetical protein